MHRVHAGAKQPRRGGLDRSVVQFQRKTPRPHPSVARALREGGSASRNPPPDIAGDAGRDDRHHPPARELFHEQVQEIGLYQIQRRLAGQHFPFERRAARLIAPSWLAPVVVRMVVTPIPIGPLLLRLGFEEWMVVPVPLAQVLAVVMVFVVVPIVIVLVIAVVDAVAVVIVLPVLLLPPVVLLR